MKMLQFVSSVSIFLFTVSTASLNSVHKSIVTESPHKGTQLSKHRKLPTHISEFTDPDTGRNPFLDLEEGSTSAGRNVMKDERRDPPAFDFDIIEGDAVQRESENEDSKETLKTVGKWPLFEEATTEQLQLTTVQIENASKSIPTTMVSVFEVEERSFIKEIEGHKIKTELRNSKVPVELIIYISAGVTALIVLAGLGVACWCRHKFKRTSQVITPENGELVR